MADFAARTFVIVFFVIYLAVTIGLVGWSLRHWFGRFFKAAWLDRIFHRPGHANLSHHNRGAH